MQRFSRFLNENHCALESNINLMYFPKFNCMSLVKGNLFSLCSCTKSVSSLHDSFLFSYVIKCACQSRFVMHCNNNCERFISGIKAALAGNRTRAPRVAGEHSTTEPPMHMVYPVKHSSMIRVISNQ